MTDVRKHRGPHPADEVLFATDQWVGMQTAVEELSWLLDRGYAVPSSLKLVGDRHSLQERQRTAVKRSSCSTRELRLRQSKCVPTTGATGVWIDGFNLLTTIEATLAGGVIIVGRDGCYRDMASMHGTYRRVEETRPALELIGSHLSNCNVSSANWLLDQPVSNSGRLASIIREIATQHGWNWEVEVVRDPDTDLIALTNQTIVSADSMILNECDQWCNVAADLVGNLDDVWLVPLGGSEQSDG